MTRPVNAHLFSSLNGVTESPDQFQFDCFGPEEGELMGTALAGVTDLVLGRVLWEEWSEFWTTAGADDPFAAFINPIRKHVATSKHDGEMGWNSVAIDGDPVAYVTALRNGDGGGISVGGGIETIRSLFLAGVIDTLTLTVHPAVTGDGRRLFDDSTPLTRLELVEGRTTSAGNAILTYRLRP